MSRRKKLYSIEEVLQKTIFWVEDVGVLHSLFHNPVFFDGEGRVYGKNRRLLSRDQFGTVYAPARVSLRALRTNSPTDGYWGHESKPKGVLKFRPYRMEWGLKQWAMAYTQFFNAYGERARKQQGLRKELLPQVTGEHFFAPGKKAGKTSGPNPSLTFRSAAATEDDDPLEILAHSEFRKQMMKLWRMHCSRNPHYGLSTYHDILTAVAQRDYPDAHVVRVKGCGVYIAGTGFIPEKFYKEEILS